MSRRPVTPPVDVPDSGDDALGMPPGPREGSEAAGYERSDPLGEERGEAAGYDRPPERVEGVWDGDRIAPAWDRAEAAAEDVHHPHHRRGADAAKAVGRGLRAPLATVRRAGAASTDDVRREAPYGDQPTDTAIVDCALYENGHRVEGDLPYADAVSAARRSEDGFVWIGLHAPTEQQLSAIAKEFGLHPLAVEDAVYAHQRPKVEHYGDTLFVVLKTARYVDHERLTAETDIVDTGEIMVFLGKDFVITVRHGEAAKLDGVRHELESRPKMLQHGPSVVLYSVCDKVVDGYLEVADLVEADIDEVETAVFASARSDDAQRIYLLKRELLQFKRAVVPLERPLAGLVGGDEDLIVAPVHTYLRDVADHLVQVVESIEGFDETLNNVLQANLAQVAVQQNDDMRKISAWVAIAAVPTAISAIYGMNFEHMPELHWLYGYPLVIAVMLVICLLLHRAFRRSGWL